MEVEELLLKAGLEYVKQCVIEEDGIKVTQVRFSGPLKVLSNRHRREASLLFIGYRVRVSPPQNSALNLPLPRFSSTIRKTT